MLSFTAIPNGAAGQEETVTNGGMPHSPVRIGIRVELTTFGTIECDAEIGSGIQVPEAAIGFAVHLLGGKCKTPCQYTNGGGYIAPGRRHKVNE
eukprot:scaffold4652_cov122-Isochrysis_galbana.AAC.4